MSSIADVKAQISVSIDEAFDTGLMLKVLVERIAKITSQIDSIGTHNPEARAAIAAFQSAYPGIQTTALGVSAGMTSLEAWYNQI